MLKKMLMFVIPILLVVGVTSFYQTKNDGQMCNVTAKDFKEKPKEGAIILDVRTPAEYQSGHVENAVLMDISQPTFVEGLKKLDKEKEYYVYCRTGRRSTNATQIMKQLGFKKVCNVEGGVLRLTSEGVKLVR